MGNTKRSAQAPASKKFKLTVKQVEDAIKHPAQNWKGECFAIATAMVEAGLVPDGVAIYGHFVGKIDPKSFFGTRAHLGFCNHGWVLMKDGSIVDPTRWVFENVEPYIYVGPPTDYDEGGNKFKKSTLRPPPGFDPDLPEDKWIRLCFDEYDEWSACSEQVWHLLQREDPLDIGAECSITPSEAHWLGNVPYQMFWHKDAGMDLAPNIYKALHACGFKASIPMDNWLRAKRVGQGLQIYLP